MSHKGQRGISNDVNEFGHASRDGTPRWRGKWYLVLIIHNWETKGATLKYSICILFPA